MSSWHICTHLPRLLWNCSSSDCTYCWALCAGTEHLSTQRWTFSENLLVTDKTDVSRSKGADLLHGSCRVIHTLHVAEVHLFLDGSQLCPVNGVDKLLHRTLYAVLCSLGHVCGVSICTETKYHSIFISAKPFEIKTRWISLKLCRIAFPTKSLHLTASSDVMNWNSDTLLRQSSR